MSNKNCCSTSSEDSSHIPQEISRLILKLSLLFGLPLYITILILPTNNWSLYLYIIAYFLLGYDVILQAIKSPFKKDFFNENTLMTVATLGAFFLGENAEAVGVMLFYKIGEYLQDRAVSTSKKNIQSLFKLQPNTAFIMKNGSWEEEHPKNISIGSIILVKKGAKIPLDGIITKGQSYIDTSSLTGESLPVNVDIDSFVYSGTINLGEAIEMKVLKDFQDSSIQKLIQLVEEASTKKSSTEKFITRFARKYTPIVFLLASLVFVVPVFFLGAEWRIWLEKSIIFLVISCPCALVLSIPLSFFSGLGVASKKGILIKSGEYLETLTKLKNIAFDKTGTITHGNLKLHKLFTLDNIEEKEALQNIALVENYSSHPIALSLKQEYISRYGELPQIALNIEEIAGKGLKAQFNDKEILVGSSILMQDAGISFISFNLDNIIGTQVYCAINKQPIAIAIISDTIKETSTQAIKELQSLGINISIFSGDNKPTVSYVAKELGIKHYKGELLPQDKVTQIQSLKQNGLTAFVGDGLNDAPSLSAADLGIAMGNKGADLTIETADIVTLEDDLRKIPQAIKIAQKTVYIAKTNIILALSIKCLVMTLTLFGLSSLWEGIIADVGVALLTVVNSSRILR